MLNNFLLSTGSDNFIEGLGISLAGIIIVFAVLLIICAILYGFGKVFAQKPAAAPAVEPAAQEEPEETEAEEESEDSLEVVAAITAAIACCLGTSTDGFVVRSFKRGGKKRGR